MAKSLNRCSFIGRLGQDPEQKFLPNGGAVCNFSIACSESWIDKNSGEKKEKTEWVRVVAFSKLAEICSQWLTKGSQIYAEGKFQTRSWDKDGVTHYSTEILLENMQMLGGNPNQDGGHQAAPQQAAPQREQPNPNYNPSAGPNNDFDDSIPF